MSKNPLTPKRFRKNFGKIKQIVEIPDLIGMQRESFQRFLQMDVPPEKREEIGLQTVFKSVFPIKDFTGSASLEFVSYRFGEVKHSIEECVHRGMTYEIPLRLTVRLVVYEIDVETGVSNIRDIKEQEIYFGTIPLMTEKGTFIINGTERVVVSQLHRSSGVFFDHDKGKSHSSGKIIYSSRIIPVRGSWIDMEVDPKDIVHIRIDRRRKFPVTLLFKAFGYTTEDLLSYFYDTEKIIVKGKRYFKEFNEAFLKGKRASKEVRDSKSGEVIVKKGRVFTIKAIKRLSAIKAKLIPINVEEIIDHAFASTIVDPDTGEPIVKVAELIDEEVLTKLSDAGINEFDLLYVDAASNSDSIRKTLLLDKVETKEEALIEIYRRLRPGNPATPEVAQDFLDNQGVVDDIDHLGNRRVRAVGELLENQYRIGLVRMERAIKERMSLQEVDALMPHDLVNPKPVSAVVKEFFGTSQLSQFMDQTNPLSETTHKRRLSALGPGGLTRERAGFEVRDVHPSHDGRICPIETPEGPNIGLIVSLSTYA
ncbi:MAG: DNA-directed RNA polymerase subunit beta, partial [Desulfobacterales bacterium]